MTEIMGQRQGFGEVLVQPELPGQRAGDLGHLQRMGQSGAVVVALVEHEHLGLVLQPAERGGMDHPVAIPAERAAGPARRLGDQPAAAAIGVAGIGRAGAAIPTDTANLVPIHLILRMVALNYVGRGIPNELGMTHWTIGDQR